MNTGVVPSAKQGNPSLSVNRGMTMSNEKQLNERKQNLKNRFYDLREEIRQELLKSDNEKFNQLAGEVHDLEEASVADLMVDIQLASVDRHVEEIRDIDSALIRIAAGTYGICSGCGEDIAPARLDAYPTAKRCRPCQIDYEKSHAHPGRPSL